MDKEYPIGWHEVLDRVHVVTAMWGDFVVNHPMMEANPEVCEVAEKVEETLGAFYQFIGNIIHEHKHEKE